MSKTVTWKQGANGEWHAEHRGLAIRINVDGTGRPKEIQWFVAGRCDESCPVTCTIEVAKRIALEG